MKRSLLLTALFFLSACWLESANATDNWNKSVGTIRGPDGRPCTFFTLNGGSPEPATPGVAWLVLRQATSGYKENLAILMSGKLTGSPVHVSTTGIGVPECNGTVEAHVVMLP